MSYAPPVATDDGPTLTVASTPVSGSTFPLGTTTVVSIATDAAGHTASCSFTVTVRDTEPPVVSCPADIVRSNDAGEAGARVSFTPGATDNVPGVSVASTPITFVNQPTPMEVSDSAANLLSAAIIAGSVAIAQGVEADVAPRPGGNGSVTTTDWVQVGRFVGGLDIITPAEFQRADCAPRLADDGVTPVLGDGLLSVRDWVQAGRYAAGLDPPIGAGGPTAHRCDGPTDTG